MLCGFDWIVENLLLRRGITRAGRAESVGQMAVCGEHIGGSLATALALTECRVGQPGIVVAAVSNPVVDWVSLDQVSKPKAGLSVSKKSSLQESTVRTEVESLLQLRRRLFRKPEDYFDPFASPVLFFRSASAEVPPPPQDIPVDDLEQLSLLQREEHHREEYHREELGMASAQADTTSKVDDQHTPALRRASRRFPSKALGLRLPQFSISTGSAPPLRDQAEELTHVLRQSFVRLSKYATPGYSEFGRKVLMEDEVDELDDDQRAVANRQAAEAERKVELHVHNGSGGWSDGAHGRARFCEAAMWLRQKLE
jgi:acetyl esterase/lipase